MKRILLAVMVLLTISTAAQDYSGNCTVDRFSYLYTYAQPRGAGVEIGLWPQDALVGAAFGVAYQSTQRQVVKGSELVTEAYLAQTIYTKGTARVNRFIYVTGAIGIYELTDPYLQVGTRFSAPIGRGNICAIVVEPQYTTRGFNVLGGIGVAW